MRCGIDHVLEQTQRIGLAVGGHEVRRRRHVLAVGYVQPAQPAVPGSDIDRVFARRIGRPDHRRRGQPAGAKHLGSPGIGSRLPITAELLFPNQLAGLDIDGVKIVRHAGNHCNLARAVVGFDARGDQRREQGVHFSGFVIELDLPQQLRLADVGPSEDRLVPLPCGPLRVAAVGQPIGAPSGDRTEGDEDQDLENSHSEHTPTNVSRHPLSYSMRGRTKCGLKESAGTDFAMPKPESPLSPESHAAAHRTAGRPGRGYGIGRIRPSAGRRRMAYTQPLEIKMQPAQPGPEAPACPVV